MISLILAAVLTVCQIDWDLTKHSEYVDFKNTKTYFITTQECKSTQKKKYVPPPPPPPPVIKKEKPKCTPTVVENVKLGPTIYFDFGSAKLKKSEIVKLDRMIENEDFEKVKIIGYTCDIGTDLHNKKLSEKRAKAVADYLETLGVDDIEFIGAGECEDSERSKKTEKWKFRKADLQLFSYEEKCIFDRDISVLPKKEQKQNKTQINLDNLVDYDEDLQKILEQHPEIKSFIKGGKK